MPKITSSNDDHFVKLREDEVAYLKADLESGRCSKCDHLDTFHFDETGQCWICESNWTHDEWLHSEEKQGERIDAYQAGTHCVRMYAQDWNEIDRRKDEAST